MAQQPTTNERTKAETQAMLFDAHRDGDALLIQTAMRTLELLDEVARLNLSRRYNDAHHQNEEANSEQHR